MESSNLHHQHHQLQDQLLVIGSSSSSLTTPSTYVAGGDRPWTQNFTLNNTTGNFFNVPNLNNGVVLNPIRPKNEALLLRDLNTTSMIQDSGFHWINTNAGTFTTTLSSAHDHDLQPAKIKEELSSSDSFPKFTDMLTSNNPSSIKDSHLSDCSTSYMKNESKDHMSDLSGKLLLKTISPGFPLNEHRFSDGDLYSTPAQHNSSSFGNGLVYPSINISNMNQSSSPPLSFDMNLQALDLLTSTRFSGNFSHPSLDNLELYKGLCFGPDRLQHLSHRSSCSPSKLSSTNELSEAMRPKSNNSLMAAKATQAAPKKSRSESRPSCPPFKVRKEKLGDRIAALQQLVAPFGKTDTASVLMEALGYIKFLQNQVETLSVPYMKSSRNKTNGTMQAGSTGDDGIEEPKRDLRSQGLCLVPLSCMSYVTGDGRGGCCGFWPPTNFGGGT